MSAADGNVPTLSVIVVTADSGASTHACVEAILACTLPLELILIDNGSRDGIPQAIAREHAGDPRLRVLFNHANLGFGPAVNRAAATARGRYLLVLNPDCLVDEAALRRLIAVAEHEPRAGLVGAVVLDADGRPDPASRRRDPVLARVLATLRGRGEGVNIDGEIPHALIEAEAVSGALMLLPRSLFARLGGFDEGYFLHFEDLDLCRRVREAGWRVLLAGDVRVPHGKGGSSRHRPVFVDRHKHRGLWRWLRKFDPAMRRPWVAVPVWLALWAHFLLRAPRLAYRRTKQGGR